MISKARQLSFTFALISLMGLASTPAFATVVDYSATEAVADAWAMHSGGHAFWLVELFSSGDSSEERRYVFDGTPTFSVDDGGSPGTEEDDSILFAGSIINSIDEDLTFDFEVSFDRVSADDAPGGTPKLELLPGAYIDAGADPGIDPSTWSFWLMNSGSLEGTGALAGGMIELDHRMMSGALAPAFQLGDGASGKNIAFGFSGWLDWSTVAQPDDDDFELRRHGHGDININLTTTRIPIPGSGSLLLVGLAAVGLARRRRTEASRN